VETTPRKMPTACRGTENRKGGDKKARQWRANVASLHKVLDTQTGWWRTQSQSNPSPPSNSLLTGKLTGNFVKFACWARFCPLTHEQIQRLGVKFPTQPTGNFCKRTGNLSARTGNLNRYVRSDFRMIFFGIELHSLHRRRFGRFSNRRSIGHHRRLEGHRATPIVRRPNRGRAGARMK
jgi:hypothetical protein